VLKYKQIEKLQSINQSQTTKKGCWEMAHGPKRQSTGSSKQHRDQHQKKSPKGPGQKPGPTKNGYRPTKFKE